MEYKIQAVKLAKELGGAKAAAELGIPENTMCIMSRSCVSNEKEDFPEILRFSCFGGLLYV